MCLSVLIVYCNPAPAYLLLTDNGMKRGANRCHKVLAGSAAWAVWRKWWLTGVVAHLVALPLHGWWLQRRALVIFLKWHDEVCFFVIDGCDLIRSTLFIIFDILLIILYYIDLNCIIQFRCRASLMALKACKRLGAHCPRTHTHMIWFVTLPHIMIKDIWFYLVPYM